MEKFNWKRFWNVFHYEYAKIRTTYVVVLAIAVAVVMLCDAVLMFPKVFGGSFRHFVSYMFNGSIIFVYIGVIMTSAMFAFSGSNKTLIPELTQPASNAEKFWAKFLVYWLIPTLFGLAMIWMLPFVAEHYQTQVDGQWVRMVKVNGVMTIEESALQSRWLIFRFHFFLYLCISGMMVLVSSIVYKYADPKKGAIVAGVVGFGIFLLEKYIPIDFDGSIHDYITAENCRVTIFQLALGLSIVAVCTAISYRRFCRLTLK